MPVSPDIEKSSLHSQELQSQKKREEWMLLGLSLPAIFVIALVVILPVGWLFYLSFVDSQGSFSFEHYQKMVEYKSYARVFIATRCFQARPHQVLQVPHHHHIGCLKKNNQSGAHPTLIA